MAVAKDVYEEGALIFPAVRIQRNYEHVGDLVRMMERRIRVSSQWYGDYLAGIGAARVAERRLKEMCGRYGRATVKAFINQWLDYSEQRMANAVRRLPRATLVNEGHHGSTPFLPDGIPLRVKVSVDPTAGMIDIDLRNNVDNLLCGYNQSEATATSAVLAGLFNSLESDLPKNAGSFRRVRVHLREGCVTGIPRFPHSCSVATTNVSDRMVNLTGAAFAQLGDGHGLAEGAVGPGIGMAVVSGADPRHGGAPFVNQLHLCTNGGPASPREDGWVTRAARFSHGSSGTAGSALKAAISATSRSPMVVACRPACSSCRARQRCASMTFSASKLAAVGTGVMKLARAYLTSPSTLPLSLPLPGRPKRSWNRQWLTSSVKARVRSRRPSPQIFATAILVLS